MSLNQHQDSPTLDWWIKVDARHPICIYYFGPFSSQEEAETSMPSYLSDLSQEGSQILDSKVKFCQPRQLTIYEDEVNIHDLEDSSLMFFMTILQHTGPLDSRKTQADKPIIANQCITQV